jgi:hypothetical protein
MMQYMNKNVYRISNTQKTIDVTWGHHKIWKMALSVDNWLLVAAFAKEFRGKGYTVLDETYAKQHTNIVTADTE